MADDDYDSVVLSTAEIKFSIKFEVDKEEEEPEQIEEEEVFAGVLVDLNHKADAEEEDQLWFHEPIQAYVSEATSNGIVKISFSREIKINFNYDWLLPNDADSPVKNRWNEDVRKRNL